MSELTVICGWCGTPVTPGAGFLGVSLAQVREAEAHAAVTTWDEPCSLGDLLAGPEDIRWRPGHYACAADFGEDAWEIGTDRLRSWRDLTRWTAHLMAKAWLPLTDWDELLRETADGSGTRITAAARTAA